MCLAGAVAICPSSASAVVFPAACTGTTGSTASLKSAIESANANGVSNDTVSLGTGCRYTLSTVDNNWYGPNGLPAIASDITIDGNGSTIARAGAGPPFRFFFVGANPAAARTPDYVSPGPGVLRLQDVTLTGGLAQGGGSNGGGGGAGMGGAIFSQGGVGIERSTLTGNTARGGPSGSVAFTAGGGGIGTGSSGFGGVPAGGMGTGPFTGGGTGGGADTAGGGGGAGLRTGANGGAASAGFPGPAPGPFTGTGGAGGGAGGTLGASGGDGGGGGGAGAGSGGGAGGGFGVGGTNDSGVGAGTGGGGGGAGGGGGRGGSGIASGNRGGGGGGFGGGGGGAGNGTAGNGVGGQGGFGGGGGAGGVAGGGAGYGGGTATSGAGSDGGGGAGMGGAIFNMQGQVTITNSTIAGNTAAGGEDSVTDSGKGMGGGIFNLNGPLFAAGSTFAGNSADFDGTSLFNLVYDSVLARTSRITLSNTIVARGTGSFDLATDLPANTSFGANAGTEASADLTERNLVQTRHTVGTGTITGAPLTSDPLLGALQANGGPTPTMAPAANSPVIDAGTADAGSSVDLTTDQRGLKRPVDLAAPNAADGSDIGAVERQPLINIVGPGPSTFGTKTLVTLSLATGRIPAKGPIRVRVNNRNGFEITGRLSGRTTNKVTVSKRRRVKLKAKSFKVGAKKRKTVRLALPKVLRRVLKRTGSLRLRLSAKVKDPAGKTRTVNKRVKPKLKKKKRKKR